MILNVYFYWFVKAYFRIWKDNFKWKELNEEEIISILTKEPKLIERPIIVYKNKAVVGRPKDNIDKLLLFLTLN